MADTLEQRVHKLEQESEAVGVILHGIELLCTNDEETKEKFIKAIHSAMVNTRYDLQIQVKKILRSVK